MAKYNADRLLDEVLREKGSLVRGQAPDKRDYQQVWDAFNRYVTATLERKQTLEVPNFCKIGWRVEQYQGKTKQRPHFQLADSFVRVHGLDENQHTRLPDSQLAPIEEFNYSKAAIRYSQGLTKANVFAGLRAIVHKIGDVCVRNQLSLEFEVGQFVCKERVVHFSFVGELYLKEGLEIPKSALHDVAYRPSRTFAPPSAEGLKLGIRGRGSSGASSIASGQAQGRHVEFSRPHARSESVVTSDSASTAARSEDASTVSTAATECSARDSVYRIACEKYLDDVKTECEESLALNARESTFHKECAKREAADAQGRRSVHLAHQEELKRQMRQLEAKRYVGREHAIFQASQHDFPCFREEPTEDVLEYLDDRKRCLREDLDQQVSQKNNDKNAFGEQDKEFMARAAECNRLDVQRRVAEELAMKQQQRNILKDSWERSIRLKQVQQAIDGHHMSAAKHELPNSVAGLRSVMPPLVLPELQPEGGSRLTTGSARRAPIGAAASLALRRDHQAPRSARR